MMRSISWVLAVASHAFTSVRALRKQYEPALWRGEVKAQLANIATGKTLSRLRGAAQPPIRPARFRQESGPALWMRPGGLDWAVWGEVYGKRVYTPPRPLAEGLRILDLGGHIGLFALWALDHWNPAVVTSVEPDPSNRDVLLKNRAERGDDRLNVVAAAAATHTGRAPFSNGQGVNSRLTSEGNHEVETVDALELMTDYDFVKIDIEGGEWPLLRDPRFPSVCPEQLVIEYHPTEAVSDPAREARSRLEAAGYEVESDVPQLPGIGLFWCRKRKTA